MKQRFDQILREIASLLRLCRWEEKAEWFDERRKKTRPLAVQSPEFKSELRSIRKIIAGMGSFTDLPLVPPKGSGMREKEATARQWELANQLDEVIGQLLSPGVAEKAPGRTARASTRRKG